MINPGSFSAVPTGFYFNNNYTNKSAPVKRTVYSGKLTNSVQILYLDGQLHTSTNIVGIQIDFDGFQLFGERSGTGYTSSETKIWSAIFSKEVTFRNLIPCYRKSDNKPGMYDLCGSICPLTNSPFYINVKIGDFIVGPDIN